MNKKNFLAFCLIGISILLVSCSTPTVRTNSIPSASTSSRELNGTSENLQLSTLIKHAESSTSPQAESYYLDAARMLITLNRSKEASDILNNINTEPLALPLAAEILLQKVLLLLESNQPAEALHILESAPLIPVTSLSSSQQITYRLLKAQTHLITSNYLKSAQERIHVDNLLPVSNRIQNHEYIWSVLNAATEHQLQSSSNKETDTVLQGWYQLGLLGKTHQYNLDKQLAELHEWRQQWSQHPANNPLPQALFLIETMARDRPEQIALLLPLSTPAGKVIRDGFMSAYYNAQESGGKVPVINFYDTSSTDNIASLHQQAVSDGAALIIGPLFRKNVAKLQSNQNLQVPTLVLNQLDSTRPISSLLYQFSLSPENEAQQIANRAWRDGHRYAAILSPNGSSSNDSYTRKRNSFMKSWTDLGGEIVAQELFTSQYTETIESLLDLDHSESRQQSLSTLIGQDVEFTQRRRQDIDFIFLIAQASDARQINPRFSYLYAGDLPVYASQDIYTGILRPLEDADLNGIQFSDSPWLLSGNDELHTVTQRLFPQTHASTLRLQAFGIDAFRIFPRLKQLEVVAESQIYGATGRLKLDSNRNILRELSWAKIQDGQAVLIDQAD